MLYKYAGLIGITFFLLIWVILFFYKKNLRKEMLIMSILAAPLGPLSEIFYLKDYWSTSHLFLFSIFGIGISDILFAFFIGGIASVIYESFFVKKNRKTKKESLFFVGILGAIGVMGMIVFNLVLKFNSIYVSSIFFIVIGIIILVKRRDLLRNALFSGLLMAIIMLLFYLIYTHIFPNIINDSWKLENISGFFLIGVPIEELIWGFSWGFLCGPFYEFLRGEKEPNKKN